MVVIAYAVIAVGAFLILSPDCAARGLKKFYRNYPFIRYASDRQFETRKVFIVLLGITFVLVGLVALLGTR
jgi:hypothetical protein